MPLLQCCRHNQVVITSSLFSALLLKRCIQLIVSQHILMNLTYSVDTCLLVTAAPRVFPLRNASATKDTPTYLISRQGGFPFSKTFSGAFEDRQPVICAKVVISFANDINTISALHTPSSVGLKND